MLDMFRLRNKVAVSRLFGGSSYEEALRIVSMSLVRSPWFGVEWEVSGRGITATRATQAVDLTASIEYTETVDEVGAFGSLPFEFYIEPGNREFLQIVPTEEASGAVVEISNHGPSDVLPGEGIWFCLVEGRCTCPDGTGPRGGSVPPVLGERHGVGTVFATDGGSVGLKLEAFDLERVCTRLVGTWELSVMDKLAALLAPYGGVPAGLTCRGKEVLTFAADSSFVQTITAECPSLRDPSRVFRSEQHSTGTYEDMGDSFVLSDVRTVGQILLGGYPLPLADFATNERVGYTIEGNQLTIEFTTPDRARIVLTYTRVD